MLRLCRQMINNTNVLLNVKIWMCLFVSPHIPKHLYAKQKVTCKLTLSWWQAGYDESYDYINLWMGTTLISRRWAGCGVWRSAQKALFCLIRPDNIFPHQLCQYSLAISVFQLFIFIEFQKKYVDVCTEISTNHLIKYFASGWSMSLT